MREEREAGRVGLHLRVGRKVMRGEMIFCRKSFHGSVGKTSWCIREEKHEEGVLNRIGTTGGFSDTLEAGPTT
jgi:hypothetical protein